MKKEKISLYWSYADTCDCHNVTVIKIVKEIRKHDTDYIVDTMEGEPEIVETRELEVQSSAFASCVSSDHNEHTRLCLASLSFSPSAIEHTQLTWHYSISV